MFFSMTSAAYSQQITMKVGAALGKIDSREIGGEIKRMLNVYWETNYGLRVGSYKFVTFGLAYLGAGGKFSDTYVPGVFDVSYHVRARFNNVLTPIKFKVSTEHRKKPRLYGYVGAAPGVMFRETRYMEFDDGHEYNKKQDEYLFNWTPRHFQNYLLAGIGVYYRHILVEFSTYVSTFKDYKEFKSPIAFNSGLMLSAGYQVSHDRAKRW